MDKRSMTNKVLVSMTPEQEQKPVAWSKSKGSPSTADYIAALNSLGYAFRLNMCSDQIEVNGAPMSDVRRAVLRSQLRDLYYDRVNVAEDAWITSANDNKYHPVQDFLNGLTWDGEDHIAKLGEYIQDTEGLFAVFFKRWAVGAVARAFEPQSCQNRMLVLDGDQGIGKSFFARWLGEPLGRPTMIAESAIAPDNKDHLIRLMSVWLWEVGELQGTTRRADREALKDFLSIQQVTVRVPYGHYPLSKPALSSFIGTLNSVGGFLDDPTGYRRFMTVHVTGIKQEYARDMDAAQIWAQAKALYDAGVPWTLTKEESAQANAVNADYEVADPLTDLIKENFDFTGDPDAFLTIANIRDVLRTYCDWRLRTPKGEGMAIAGELKRCFPGIMSKRETVNGKQIRGYAGLTSKKPLLG